MEGVLYVESFVRYVCRMMVAIITMKVAIITMKVHLCTCDACSGIVREAPETPRGMQGHTQGASSNHDKMKL